MPRPTLRTRSKKRHKLRLPGGRIDVHFFKEKTKVAKCAICQKPLATTCLTGRQLKALPKTAKRPERIYGGFLCPDCLREALKKAIRGVA